MNGPAIHLSKIIYRNVKATDKANLPVRQKRESQPGQHFCLQAETRLMFAMLIYNVYPWLVYLIMDTLEP